MRHHTDSFRSAIAEKQRHADFDILGAYEEAEQTRAGFVCTQAVTSENSFDDGSLTNAANVDRVLEAFLDSFDARVLNNHNRCL